MSTQSTDVEAIISEKLQSIADETKKQEYLDFITQHVRMIPSFESWHDQTYPS